MGKNFRGKRLVVKRKIENRQPPFGFLSEGTSAAAKRLGLLMNNESSLFCLRFSNFFFFFPASHPLAALFLSVWGALFSSASVVIDVTPLLPPNKRCCCDWFLYYYFVYFFFYQGEKKKKRKIPFGGFSCHFFVLLLAPLEAMSTFPDHFIQLFFLYFYFFAPSWSYLLSSFFEEKGKKKNPISWKMVIDSTIL